MRFIKNISFFYLFVCLLLFQFFPAFSSDNAKSQHENRKETLLYGLESDVIELIDTFIKEKDRDFLSEIHDVFASAKSTALKDKIILYYTELKY